MFIRDKQACDATLLIILSLFILGITPLLMDHSNVKVATSPFKWPSTSATSMMVANNISEIHAIYHDPDLKCAYPDRFRWMQPFFTWYEVLQQECDALGKLLV